jgi:hypothetical protein
MRPAITRTLAARSRSEDCRPRRGEWIPAASSSPSSRRYSSALNVVPGTRRGCHASRRGPTWANPAPLNTRLSVPAQTECSSVDPEFAQRRFSSASTAQQPPGLTAMRSCSAATGVAWPAVTTWLVCSAGRPRDQSRRDNLSAQAAGRAVGPQLCTFRPVPMWTGCSRVR